MSEGGNRLLLVDGHSILNRAFYGMPDLTNTKGVHTGAVYGFLNILFSQLDEIGPDYLAVAFDVHAPTFRHEAFADYKGTRKAMPEELRQQVPLIRQMLAAMKIEIFEKAGLEADDILGTLAKKAEAQGMDVVILSGDRDLLQIATERICIRIPRTRRGQTEIDDFNAARVQEEYGVTPLQFIEVKALMGDSSDNIPGVPKVGEKTAVSLIQSYGSVDGVYEHLDEIKKPALHRNLEENEDLARMSLFLAAIKTDCEVEIDRQKASAGGYFTKEAFELCSELGFKNFLSRFDKEVLEEKNGKAGVVSPFVRIETLSELGGLEEFLLPRIQGAGSRPFSIGVFPIADIAAYGTKGKTAFLGAAVSYMGPVRSPEEGGRAGQDASQPSTMDDAGSGGWFIRVREDRMPGDAGEKAGQKEAAEEAVTESVGDKAFITEESLCGFLRRMRLAVRTASETVGAPDAAAGKGLPESKNEGQETAEKMQPEHTGPMLAVFGQKEQMPLWAFEPREEFDSRVRMEGIIDLLVCCYLANPLKNDYEIEDMANEYLGITLQGRKQLFGKDLWAKAAEKDEEAVISYACRAADALAKAAPLVKDRLEKSGMWELYTKIERPLTFILSDMERIGIRIHPGALQEYSAQLGGRIDELERQIYEETGVTFNIASPKQLGEVLFEKLGLPGGKKTKTGYSTAAGVLEKLAPDYPVVNDILEYRGLTKLRSTYADGLTAYVADDGKIHTTLKQTITATGRISSTDPNLQNIPMKTELGRKIRKAFIPREGWSFTDADYSQIELRILAHMSGDPGLIDAYRENKDIHRITASRVFHTPFEEVTPLQRRNAKAVNFGIVYGISSFGLSQGLSISRFEAAEYIKAYFRTYPGIKAFLDRLVAAAKRDGFAQTLYGRRRPVPELSSSNFMQRSFGERVAMNSPIQGTAADIMKIAMIRVWERIFREKLSSRLILQIHDELLVETAPGEEEEVRRILEEEMGQAADLSVRLETDVHRGADWYMAK